MTPQLNHLSRGLSRFIAAMFLACLPGTAAFAAEPAPTAAPHEHFDFKQAGKSVTVWYFIPAAATPQTPIVFVMHGVGRNGEDYLADWLPIARERKFLLVVPEFSKTEFPGDEGYNYGNTVDREGHAVAREQWSFAMIEPIFDAVRTRTGNRTERYRIYGHSAGAQFVQRFVYFVPTARVERVISANAGWYMLPDLATMFPYGLKNTPVTEADLRHALGLPLTVLLGTADVDAKAKALRHTPEAEAQGPYRFARGNFFFRHGQEAAAALHTPFGWQLATAPNIAHSDAGMAPFAAAALFSAR
jgi:hypothetical protein